MMFIFAAIVAAQIQATSPVETLAPHPRVGDVAAIHLDAAEAIRRLCPGHEELVEPVRLESARHHVRAVLLVAIAKRRKNLPASLYEILQIVSVSSLEQIPIEQLFAKVDTRDHQFDIPKQLEIKWS